MKTPSKKLSESTREHYQELIGRIGEEYIDYRWKRHPVSRSHYQQTQKSVEFALRSLGGPVGHLLEIGCGPGTWTDICLRNSRKMTIVDISSEMLKLVRKRFSESPIDLVCGDFISDDIVLEQSFDTIFSARAVEYMDDKAAMVSKAFSLLKPRGQLIIITKNPGWMDRKRELKRSVATKEGDIHADWISWHDMENLYRKQGFSNVVSFPVCIGSYHSPLNSKIGIKLCDLFQNWFYQRKINSPVNFFSESYLTIGQKSPQAADE